MIDWAERNLELRRRRDELNATVRKRAQQAEAQAQFRQHQDELLSAEASVFEPVIGDNYGSDGSGGW